MAQIARVTVSTYFYELCLEVLPALKHHKAYRRMVAYILFGGFRDKDTNYLIISRDILAQIEGKEIDAKQNNYSAVKFLKAFQRDVLPDFRYSDHNAKERKARVVTCDGIPERITHALLAELRKDLYDTGRVYMEDGSTFSKKKVSEERTQLKETAAMFQCHTEASQTVLDYMNNLTPHAFTAIVERNYSDALTTAQMICAEDEEFLHNARVLRKIRNQVQPFYQPADVSNRIFPLNESMLLLTKEVRQTLTRGWIEFDLKAAHLAINAHLWNCPVVTAFLQSGTSIWAVLADTYGLQLNSAVKRLFKEKLYSICYGKQEKTIKAEFTAAGLSYEPFLEHPVIKDLLEGRNSVIDEIQSAGGAYTCFGIWISLQEYNMKQVLSILAQAVELQLLLPVIPLAQKYKNDFTITLWQHDGFTVSIVRERELFIERIKDVVNRKAEELNVVTELEVSYVL